MDIPTTSKSQRWKARWHQYKVRARRFLPFSGGVIAAFIALMLYNRLIPGPQPLTLQEVNEAVAENLASATPAPAFSARVYQAIQPSLVLIRGMGADETDDSSIGSGVVISEQGDILTSLHVVEKASEIQIIFADGTQSSAQLTTAQPEIDIAVLRADQPPLQLVPATLGNPNAMRVGDEAFAVGNPFGLYSSISAGVISGFNRSFKVPDSDQRLEGLIQMDSAVNPGNSGGPLLNRSGHVVGIVVGILNPVQEEFFVGIGFAVPITVAGSPAGIPPY
jgi:S1-C subfamily serine protease